MKKKASLLSILLLTLVCMMGTLSAKAATTYKVYYDYQGGKSSTTYKNAYQTKKHGVNLTLRKDTPVKSGYVFLGYRVSLNAGNASYQPGGTYKSNSSVTLYAMWAPSKYTITYNANGGSFSIKSAVKNYGKTYTVPQTVPTRTGYTFAGWGLTSTAKNAYVKAGGKLTANQNYKLYAIWTPKTYTVTYNYGNGNVVTEKRTYGQTYKVKTPHITKDAYAVQGWSLNQNSTTVAIKTGDKITAAQNITLYPVWILKTYKITLRYPVTNVVNGQLQTTLSSVVIDKKHGVNLDLNGYYNINHIRGTGVCTGWATSNTATTPTYTTTYTANKNATLYLITSSKFNNQLGGTVYYDPDYLNNERFYLNDSKYVDDDGNVIGNMFYNVPKTYKVVYMPYNYLVNYYREEINKQLKTLKDQYAILTYGKVTTTGAETLAKQLDVPGHAIDSLELGQNIYSVIKTLFSKSKTTDEKITLTILQSIAVTRTLCGFAPGPIGLAATTLDVLDYTMLLYTTKTSIDDCEERLAIIDSCIANGYGIKLTYSMAYNTYEDSKLSPWKNNSIYVNHNINAGVNSDGSYMYTGKLYANKVSYGKYDLSWDTYVNYFMQ